jgi:histone arginine demethylase JMJD6
MAMVMSVPQTDAMEQLGPAPQQSEMVVDRRSGLGLDEFIAEYRIPRRPVILTDAARDWPLYGRGSPAYFRQHFGSQRVRVREREYALGELLDLLEASTLERPGPYPCKYAVADEFRALLDEVAPRFAYSLPDRQAHPWVPQKLFRHVNNLEIFFGGPGGEFPYLHYDVLRLHAWITQLHGDKEFTVYAPGQEHLLYVNPEIPWQSSIQDHHHPDYARYPLFRQAQAQKLVIHAGETLFLPCGWWHTARSLNMTISIAFDQLGADNWRDFIGDVVAERKRLGHPGKARLIGGYLGLIAPWLGIAERFGANHARNWGAR